MNIEPWVFVLVVLAAVVVGATIGALAVGSSGGDRYDDGYRDGYADAHREFGPTRPLRLAARRLSPATAEDVERILRARRTASP